jgi:hypothetical protein
MPKAYPDELPFAGARLIGRREIRKALARLDCAAGGGGSFVAPVEQIHSEDRLYVKGHQLRPCRFAAERLKDIGVAGLSAPFSETEKNRGRSGKVQ